MFQLTLKSARMSCGYSIEEIAQRCDIEASYYSKIEQDLSMASFSIIKSILGILGVDAEMIYFGPEEDCIRKNRERVSK